MHNKDKMFIIVQIFSKEQMFSQDLARNKFIIHQFHLLLFNKIKLI